MVRWALLLLSISLTSSTDISYFHTGIFYPNRDPGLYEVESGLQIAGHLLASFGYFDSDKL